MAFFVLVINSWATWLAHCVSDMERSMWCIFLRYFVLLWKEDNCNVISPLSFDICSAIVAINYTIISQKPLQIFCIHNYQGLYSLNKMLSNVLICHGWSCMSIMLFSQIVQGRQWSCLETKYNKYRMEVVNKKHCISRNYSLKV